MKYSLTIVFSSAVFLLGVFLFEAIAPALFFTVVFFFANLFFEKPHEWTESEDFKRIINYAENLLVGVLLALAVYCLLYLPIEFFLTEILYKIPRFPKFLPIMTLLSLTFVFNLIDWKKVFSKKRITVSLFLTLLTFSVMVYKEYRQEKLPREYLPKIYSVSADWGIQQTKVTITGVNFGPIWQKGKVSVDDLAEFNVLQWSDEKIEAEMMVPKKIGKGNIFVLTKGKKKSNPWPFEVKDPKELNNRY